MKGRIPHLIINQQGFWALICSSLLANFLELLNISTSWSTRNEFSKVNRVSQSAEHRTQIVFRQGWSIPSRVYLQHTGYTLRYSHVRISTLILFLPFPLKHPLYPMKSPHSGCFDITFSFWVISASAPNSGFPHGKTQMALSQIGCLKFQWLPSGNST